MISLREFLESILSSSVSIILIYFLALIIKNEILYRRFKARSPSIPIVPNRNLLTGHTNSFLLNWNNCKVIDENHKKLGKTYAFLVNGRAHISTIDLEVIKTMAMDRGNINKSDANIPIPEWSEDSISYAVNGQWRKLRRAIAPAFSMLRVKSANVQADIDSVINRFVTAIEWRLKRAKEEKGLSNIEIDAGEFFQRYTLDLMFTCLYKQPNQIDYYSAKDTWQTLHEAAEKSSTNLFYRLSYNFPILYHISDWILKFEIHPVGKVRTKIMNFIKEQAKEYFVARRENENSKSFDDAQRLTLKDGSEFRRNLTDLIIERVYDGSLTEREYLHSSFFLSNAAYKTTSDVLSRLIYQLAKYQKVQEKLRKSVLSEGEESNYLDSVIRETLRLFPPTPLSCSRTLSNDISTTNGIISEGTSVWAPVSTIHRWKEYWGENAEEFYPERWENAQQFNPFIYMPFGAGRRICPGTDFALNEMKKLLTSLVNKFDFQLTSTPVDLDDNCSPALLFLVRRSPIPVRISSLLVI